MRAGNGSFSERYGARPGKDFPMRFISSFVLGLVATSLTVPAQAQVDYGDSWPLSWKRPNHKLGNFQRVATLPNYLNNADIADTTVSEIVAATADGNTLVYTDSPLEEVGFVDITDPAAPLPTGKLALGGEPTSVSILPSGLALVGVNTSASYVSPSGTLAVVDVASQTVLEQIPLGGQPDSVAVSPDGAYAAVVIENERDEDIEVDGVEGGLPQLPAGYLVIVDLVGDPGDWATRTVDLSGLSAYAPEDPEPEFVDVNADNQAVVSLQENNHLVLVDLPSGAVIGDFPAGTQSLSAIDATEDGIISLSESLFDVPREPDAVTWLDRGGNKRWIGTANEGDLFGGSRGFSIFEPNGTLAFDSGNVLEHIAVRFGHYPEGRSDAKGAEPEAIEFARFGHTDFVFVGSERGSFIAVFRLRGRGQAEFVNLLPAPLGPEGVVAIPSRNLLVVSGEEDEPSFNVRSSIMIYELTDEAPTYPQILSGDDFEGKPIAWSALSGMTAVPGSNSQLLAVWDSAYTESRIFALDTSETPAVITSATTVQGGSGDHDPEGITVAPDGSYWLASEGNASGSRPNRLLQTAPDGTLLDEVYLPSEIEACRAASSSTGTLGSGFEGLAAVAKGEAYDLWVAQQRGWNYTTPECEGLDDDLDDTNPSEPGFTRIWRYRTHNGRWRHYQYELEPLPANASWVGLSEITAVKGGFMVIERDNRTGDFGALKTLVKFRRSALRDGVVTRDEKEVYDLLPDLLATNGLITDKPEGVAVTDKNEVFVVTDNDGVDDWSGETWFLRLGKVKNLF